MMDVRTYAVADCVVFSRPATDWGLLSNFAHTPLKTPGGMYLPTGEHLFQVLKFDDALKQVELARIVKPGDMKQKQREWPLAYPDWNARRLAAMRFVLRMKVWQHGHLYIPLLKESVDMEIVEKSMKDAFWGAVPQNGALAGDNILGRLWMELRTQLQEKSWHVEQPVLSGRLALKI